MSLIDTARVRRVKAHLSHVVAELAAATPDEREAIGAEVAAFLAPLGFESMTDAAERELAESRGAGG